MRATTAQRGVELLATCCGVVRGTQRQRARMAEAVCASRGSMLVCSAVASHGLMTLRTVLRGCYPVLCFGGKRPGHFNCTGAVLRLFGIAQMHYS